MTQRFLPLVSVRDASGSELEKAWPAVTFLTNRKSRGRCSGMYNVLLSKEIYLGLENCFI